jgi:hypothetical protein
MAQWQVIELSHPAGYADRKPPYDFKHGWVPITGEAKAAVVPKVENPEDLSKLTPQQLEKIPKIQRYGPSKAQGTSLERWREIVNTSLAKPDESPTAPKTPEPPPVPTKAAPRRRKTPVRPSPVHEDKPMGLSGTQSRALASPGHEDTEELTKEWSSATALGDPLDDDESEAVHQWQNGYTEALFDENAGEDAPAETGLYLLLNDMLAGSGKYDLGALDEDDLANLDLMNERLHSALAKSKTSRDVTLFRGISDMPDVQTGDVITDARWQATSYNPSTASAFLGGGTLGAKAGPRSKMLVISVPKGKNALAVRERASHEKVFGTKHEVVLGPNTPMKVTGQDGQHIYLEVQ